MEVYYSDEKQLFFESIIFDLQSFGIVDQFNYTITTNKTLAPYAQGTFDLSNLTGLSGLSVTAELRYTIEKVRLTRQRRGIYVTNPQDGFVLGPQPQKFKKYSWQLGIREQGLLCLWPAVRERVRLERGGAGCASHLRPSGRLEILNSRPTCGWRANGSDWERRLPRTSSAFIGEAS